MSALRHSLRFRRDHRWTPPHMSAYLDAELRLRGRARIERHLADCPECRSVLDDLRHMLGLLRSAPSPAASADVVPGIVGAVLTRLHEPSDR